MLWEKRGSKLYLWIGLSVFLSFEILLLQPAWWPILILQAALLVFFTLRQVQGATVQGLLRAALSLYLAAACLWLFIEVSWWSHLYAAGAALTIAWLFRQVAKLVRSRTPVSLLIFPLINVFLAQALAHALHTFLPFSWLSALLTSFCLVMLFPAELVIKDSNLHSRPLPFPNYSQARKINFWLSQSFASDWLQKPIGLAYWSWWPRPWSLAVSPLKFFLLLLNIEAFFVVWLLPWHILVGSSLFVLGLACCVRIIDLSLNGRLSVLPVLHNLAVTLTLMLLVISTARWS